MKRLLLLAVALASLLSSSFVFPAVALESTPADDYVANRNEPSIEEKLESLANARPDLVSEYERQAEVPFFHSYETRSIPGCVSFGKNHASVCGAILAHYQAIGGVHSWLGEPLTDELTNPDGIGKRTEFELGSIYWSPKSSAHAVTRDGMRQWGTLGWENGELGYPISDPIDTRVPLTQYQNFQGGDNYYNPIGGGAVWGDIKTRYDAIGGSNHPIGIPVTNEELSGSRFRFNNFSNGTMSWRSDDRAVRFMYLQEARVWTALGRELGPLEFPERDEVSEVPGVYHYVSFGEKGVIVWNVLFGARELLGGPYRLWRNLSKDGDTDLGFPLTDNVPFQQSSVQMFSSGAIIGLEDGLAVISATDTNSATVSVFSDLRVRAGEKNLASKYPDSGEFGVLYGILNGIKWPSLGVDRIHFVIRKGFYERYSARDDAGWGWEKISKKHNIKNVKILEAIVRLDRAPVESSIEKGNFKSTSEVRFYDCGFVVNGVGGQCRQIYTPIFVSEVFRPLSQPYYKGVRAQTRKRGVKDNHPVGVVTAWCHRDSEDASGKNFSRCPDYVNTTKEFGKWR